MLVRSAVIACCAALAWSAAFAGAAEHRVVATDGGPPADALSKEITTTLSAEGMRVVRGKSRTVCEFWPCKTWKVPADFKPTAGVLYPFTPGQLIGVVRFTGRGADFRDQTIAKGVYTLRYGQQPVDGNHEGTSPTRDFLCLVKSEKDRSPAPLDLKKLQNLSADAAGSNHPAIWCLQRVNERPASLPAMAHDKDHDWWSLLFVRKTEGNDKPAEVVVKMVIVGVAQE